MILLYYDRVHKEDKINTSQLTSPFSGNGQRERNLAQNCDTLCLLICSTLTICLTLCSIMKQDMWTVVLINFLKISPFQAKGQLGSNFALPWPKIIQSYISWSIIEIFLKHFSMIRHKRSTIITLVSFPRNPALVQLGNLSPFWAKIMQPYIASNCLMICSLRFLKCCHMIGFNI